MHVLTITHRHGANVTVHDSHSSAFAQLTKYVSDGWDPEWPPQPVDGYEAVVMFFDRSPDEEWRIEPHEVEQPEIVVTVQPIVWEQHGWSDWAEASKRGIAPPAPQMWFVHIDTDYVGTITLETSGQVHRRTGEPLQFLTLFAGVHRLTNGLAPMGMSTVYGTPTGEDLGKLGRHMALLDYADRLVVKVGPVDEQVAVDLPGVEL